MAYLRREKASSAYALWAGLAFAVACGAVFAWVFRDESLRGGVWIAILVLTISGVFVLPPMLIGFTYEHHVSQREGGDLNVISKSAWLPNEDPDRIAYGEGALWVTSGGNNRIIRVDLNSYESGHLASLEDTPIDITVGGGAIWFIHGGRYLSRLDPSTRTVTGTVELSSGFDPHRITFGGGAVWVADGGRVVSRVDPFDMTVTEVVRLSDRIIDISFGSGSLWIAHWDFISRLDTDTGAISTAAQMHPRPTAIASGEDGAIWVLDDDAVVCIDPMTGSRIVKTDRLGVVPSDLTCAPHALWTANGKKGTISRIDL